MKFLIIVVLKYDTELFAQVVLFKILSYCTEVRASSLHSQKVFISFLLSS